MTSAHTSFCAERPELAVLTDALAWSNLASVRLIQLDVGLLPLRIARGLPTNEPVTAHCDGEFIAQAV